MPSLNGSRSNGSANHERRPSNPESVLVDFDGHREHPHEWPFWRKLLTLCTVGVPSLLMPLSSTIVSPVSDAIKKEFDNTSISSGPLMVSLFLFAYCSAPLLLGPLSELWGRKIVLQSGTVFFAAFNLGCGFSQTMAQLLICRFFSGIGAGASLVIGSSMVADTYRQEERGGPFAWVSLPPVLGSCIGPVVGAFINDYTDWRWAFWSTSIAAAIYFVPGCFTVLETYPPVLLQRKKGRIFAEMEDHDSEKPTPPLRTPYDKKDETVGQMYKRTLLRSFVMLATQPIVQALAAYWAFLYGLFFLLLSTFTEIWTSKYGMSSHIGSLNYVGPCIGYLIGSAISITLSDRVLAKLKDRNGGEMKPEFRLPMTIPAGLLVPIGLFLYGWAAEYKLHWIVPDIGIALPIIGSTVIFQCLGAYLLDAYTIHAASANGAVYVMRGLAAFAFPLFSQQMYSALGYGWGNSLLGFVGLALCAIPFVLWKYGEKLRAKSSYIIE